MLIKGNKYLFPSLNVLQTGKLEKSEDCQVQKLWCCQSPASLQRGGLNFAQDAWFKICTLFSQPWFSDYFEELLSHRLKVEVLEKNSVVNFVISKSIAWLYSAMYTGQTHTLSTDFELLVLWGVVLTCMQKLRRCCDVVMLWAVTELASNVSCVCVEQRRMWCVWFLFKGWVALTVVQSFFVFLCIKNKILNFH